MTRDLLLAEWTTDIPMDADERLSPCPLPEGLRLMGRDALDPYFLVPPELDPDPAINAVLPFLGWIVTLARPRRIGLMPARKAIAALMADVAHRMRLPADIRALPFQPPPAGFDLLWLDLPPAGTPDAALAPTPDQMLPLLGQGGIVVLHGLDSGGWDDLSMATLNLGGGLGVLVGGACRGGPVARLCAMLNRSDDGTAANLAARFAAIGAHWAARRALADTQAELDRTRQALSHLRLDAMEMRLALNHQDAARQDANRQGASPPAAPPVPVSPAAPPPQGPSRWRRLARRLIRGPSTPVPASADRTIRTVLFVSGEPGTPGTTYRVTRNAAACVAAGYATRCRDCAAVGPDDIAWADMVVLWRVEYSGHVDILLGLARARGAVLAFDADDIVFEPALARTDLIDGIRVSPAPVARIERMYADMQRTMRQCDLGLATTDTLADWMRPFLKLTLVLPNSFDDATLQRARHAVRRRALASPDTADDVVRIGYATGSRTHQRDFARALPGLLRVMDRRAQVRLVLFREPGGGRPLLLTEEFPDMHARSAQIEWRDMVTLDALPDELARLDISIAPLEDGNPFCEAKSELKFFEAALAGACTVASPTAPFRAAIRPGETGLLAEGAAEWESALLRLVDDPALRRRMARDALHTVLWEYGPQRQAALLGPAIAGLGNARAAARAGATALARGAFRVRAIPQIPDSTVLFTQDHLQNAAVTVVVTAYNYAGHVIEALDSVRRQTLDPLDLIVVDDASTDDTPSLLTGWAARHGARFNRLLILRARRNAGLGGARNIGMAAAETPYILQLDADNRLLSDACARLLAVIAAEKAGYAYPLIRQFGRESSVMGDTPFHPGRLVGGNTIDAMALVAKWAWAAAGGYYVRRDAMGWEDYDLWCTLAELGIAGTQVPEILAEYRVHDTAMTDTLTERPHHKDAVVTLLRDRHPWIRLTAPEARARS
ncbi:glycosyltransferase [Gluconacetobacter diazotrophicus]|uniref:Glycosyltransferase n=1 Tax=Gluconacetobacter diazotrophicus TaxID=33996 RepID=A0A7W4FES5_GLUDI|nr:glycosyltransferase [Gluconacetobacter diazotrophicus]MBB2156179.1 glycosyltransferase [Gluconacetobacter diazotrophicus]